MIIEVMDPIDTLVSQQRFFGLAVVSAILGSACKHTAEGSIFLCLAVALVLIPTFLGAATRFRPPYPLLNIVGRITILLFCITSLLWFARLYSMHFDALVQSVSFSAVLVTSSIYAYKLFQNWSYTDTLPDEAEEEGSVEDEDDTVELLLQKRNELMAELQHVRGVGDELPVRLKLRALGKEYKRLRPLFEVPTWDPDWFEHADYLTNEE